MSRDTQNRIRTALALTLGLLAPDLARAEEIPEPFTPIRPMGMGGAFTAVANDENSPWTNPAGIARSRKARSRKTLNLLKLPNVIAGANAQARTFYTGYKGATDKSVEGVIDSLDALGDKPFWARAALYPVTIIDITRGSPVLIGALSSTTTKIVIPKDDPTQARVEAISDVSAITTFGITNASNRFNIGVSVRPIARYAYEDNIPSETLLDKTAMKKRLKDDANKSQGVGVDAGMMFTVADFWYPTVGIAVMNLPTGCRDNYLNPFTEKRETICGNVFKGNFANADALSTVDPTDARVGFSITPRFGRKINARLAVDVHQLPIASGDTNYGLQGIEASKLIHAGIEIFAGNPLTLSDFSIRSGYSQGFMTAGASLNLGVLEIAFATFGRDVSSTAKPIEDRRYLGSVSLDF